jgi:antirestriction protein ArdC
MAADVYSGYTKVPLEVLRHARDLCANFRIPPRQFRRRTSKGENGSYYPASDIVAVDVARAARDGMGGDDGYYATLLHELLHATGHQTRLGRATTGDYSAAGYALEEGTILAAQRILLRELGFGLRHWSGTRLGNRDSQSTEEPQARRPPGYWDEGGP